MQGFTCSSHVFHAAQAMILSHTAEYALRATLYIAQHQGPAGLMRTDDVADAMQVPRNYLSKILHTLAREGVLVSTRGPHGGFRLRRGAEHLHIQRVISPFDDLAPRRACILGRPRCNDRDPCPAHAMWKGVTDQVSGFIRDTTIADMLSGRGGATAALLVDSSDEAAAGRIGK
jgi:Rrf2 family iron-sulfur cluster assembly transcriptional regulator